ncbi:MAG TPA: hypothetical protein VMM92_09325, partial [Thermoanaerobaculia bacterium]|nr:hypothetical protein [Thermoanaerobaculia bacterium]
MRSIPALPPLSPAIRGGAFALTAIGLVSVIAGLERAEGRRIWADLLVNDFFFLSLALAGIIFLALHYLTSAGWWRVIRRVPEAMMAPVPVAGLLL